MIDYFIKHKDELSEEAYNRSRLLVIVLISLMAITFVLSILSFFGMFSRFTNVSIFTVLAITLYMFKRNGNLSNSFFITTLLVTVLMVYNGATNGYTLSYNNKWFVIALITIFFMKPKWLKPYTLLLVTVQTVFLYISLNFKSETALRTSIIEEYIDTVIFFGLCYSLLILLQKYQDKQNEIILKNNALLKIKSNELFESNQELEKFAFLASHDLKTPLRNIVSFSMLLEKQLRGTSEEKALEYSNFILKGSLKLDKLVNDVLSYSRFTSIKENKEEIDLNEIVDEIETSITEYLTSKNAVIKIESRLPVIYSHKSMIIQLIKNLIENGIKYNESKNPEIVISFENKSDKNYLLVSDNGIGIKEEYHNSIFTMFSRLHSEQDYEGSGIGLSLCKRIVDKIGGEITLESQLGEGTSFSILLPDSIFPET